MWPNTALKGVGQQLPTPKQFEQAVQMVSEEDVARGVVAGNDPQAYLKKIQSYVDAGFDLRSYLLASLAGRGGKYFPEVLLVLAIGEAARTLTEAELYGVIGVVSVVAVAAYLLRHRWLPERWRAIVE